MRRKIRPIDPKELIDADDINRTTIKGEMRKLWPAIHQKLIECGWTARDMVKWLDERGVTMSVELFRVYLRDLDREHSYDRSKRATTNIAPRSTINPVKTGASVTDQSNQIVRPVVKSSGKQRSILNEDKGMFGDLDPPPADGVVDLKQS